jgi:DNA-directed RNA polymerase alpha subunit
MPDPNVLITHLDLSVHTYYALHRAGLFTVRMIIEKEPAELLAIPSFGLKYLEELRAKLIEAGYQDPWPEMDAFSEADSSPRLHALRLPLEIERALLRAGRGTIAKVLGTPGDDLLGFLTWDQYSALRLRLIEQGYAEPGNLDRPPRGPSSG